MHLPDDCDLTYIVNAEAWYADAVRDRYPTLSVVAESRDGGCAWEFGIEDRSDLGDDTICLKLFSDAFDAFTQVPEFFTALAQDQPQTLPDVCAILDRLGARDATKRTGPDAPVAAGPRGEPIVVVEAEGQ